MIFVPEAETVCFANDSRKIREPFETCEKTVILQ